MTIEIEKRPAHSRGRYGVALALLIAFGRMRHALPDRSSLFRSLLLCGSLTLPLLIGCQDATGPQSAAEKTPRQSSEPECVFSISMPYTGPERYSEDSIDPIVLHMRANEDGSLAGIQFGGNQLLDPIPATDVEQIKKYIARNPKEFPRYNSMDSAQRAKAHKEAARRIGEEELFNDIKKRIDRHVDVLKKVQDPEKLEKELETRIITDYKLHYRYLIRMTKTCRSAWITKSNKRMRKDFIKNVVFIGRPDFFAESDDSPSFESTYQPDSGLSKVNVSAGFVRGNNGKITAGPFVWLPGIERTAIKRADPRWPNGYAWPADKLPFEDDIAAVKTARKKSGKLQTTLIVLRAEEDTPGGLVADVIHSFRLAGFSEFSFGVVPSRKAR